MKRTTLNFVGIGVVLYEGEASFLCDCTMFRIDAGIPDYRIAD